MSQDTDNFGAGMVSVLAILLFVGLGYLIGVGVMSAWIGSDCQNFGKSSIGGDWYECRQIGKTR